MSAQRGFNIIEVFNVNFVLASMNLQANSEIVSEILLCFCRISPVYTLSLDS